MENRVISHFMKWVFLFVLGCSNHVTGQQYNLTGSAEFAELGKAFTWTCDMFVPTGLPSKSVKFLRNDELSAAVGYINQTCITQILKHNYIYQCLSDYSFALTIPAENMTENEQNSSWKCQYSLRPLIGSLTVNLRIAIDVYNISLKPSQTTLTIREDTQMEVQCVINRNAAPPPTITWYLGSTEITSLAGKDTTSILITGKRIDNTKNLTCFAANNNKEAKSAAIKLNVVYSPSAAVTLTALPDGFKYNSGTKVTFTCGQSGGNPVSTLSWNCKGLKMSGIDQSTSSEAKSTLELTIDKSYNKQNCTCKASHLMFSNPMTETIPLTVFTPVTNVTLHFNQNSVNVNEQMRMTCVSEYCYPPANIVWYIESEEISEHITNVSNENNGLFQTTSTLLYTGLKDDHRKPVYCKASNLQNVEVESSRKYLDVIYPPSENPSISSSSQSFVYTSGDIMNLTCIVHGGNPLANLSWNCISTDWEVERHSNYTQTALILKVDKRFNNKDCTCIATHPLKTKFKSEKLTVYYASNITTTYQKTYIINEKENVTLECTVDGNPLSNITWKLAKTGSVLNTTFNSNNGFFEIPSVKCSDHGEYIIEAANGIGQSAAKFTTIAVNCRPRLFTTVSQTPDKIGIGSNESLIIHVQLVLFPPSNKVEWEFMWSNNQSHVIENNTLGYKITSITSGNEQNITLFKQNVSDKEFGNYSLTVANSVGTFTKTYKVNGARSPLPPFNLTLVCDNPYSITLTWIADFNGGDKQTFHVFSSSGENNSSFRELATFADKGFGQIHSYAPSVDLYGQLWFRITASNKFGNSTTGAILCITKSPDESPSNVAMLAGIAAGGGVCLAFVVIVVFVYFRKYHKYEKSGKHIERLNNVNENEEDSADEDGLKENGLYVSAGPRDDEKPEVAVYAAVAKKLPQSDTNSNLYADVKKSGRQETNKGTMSSEVKPKKGLFKKDEKAKHKKGKKPKNNSGEADVYENSEDIAMSTNVDNVYSNAAQKGQNKQKERGYKNKDGLLYVEVNFDGKQGQDNPVIHGEDEKTDYATVEFPMPSALHKASGSEEL